MKALTLIQPWGGLIATGVKLVENRTWPPPVKAIGERIAIHAGAKFDRETVRDLLDDGFEEHELWRVRSAVLGVAKLVGYVVANAVNPTYHPDRIPDGQAIWFNGPIGFLFENPVALAEPVPCKGMLGFWNLPPDVEAAVIAQVGHG